MIQHHVYFIITECEHFVKIGVSSNVELRFSYIQTHSPLKLKLIKIACEKRNHASKLEASLHTEFRNNRLHGEWFEYTNTMRKRAKHLSIKPKFKIVRKYRRGLSRIVAGLK